MVLLMFLLIFLRLLNLESHVTFLGDQGRDAIIMKRILSLEHFPAIGAPTSIGMVYLGPFYYYFMAPWLLIFNFNPLGPAFGVAFLSLVLGLLALTIVNKHFGRLTGFFFLFLLTFSASNISLGRFSWNPNLLPIFTFYTLYAFYRLLSDKPFTSLWKDVGFSLLFGALFSFSLQLHYLAAFLLPTLLVFFLYQINKTKQFKLLFIRLLAAIASFGFFSLPLLIFDLRHNFLNSRNFIKLFSQGDVASNASYISKLSETATGLFQHTFQVSFNGLTSLILLLLLLLAFVRFSGKKQSLFYWLMVVNLVFYILGFSLMSSGRFEHYFGPVYFSLFITLGSLFAVRFTNCSLCRKIIPIFVILYLLANFAKFRVIFTPGGYQIKQAQSLSRFLLGKISQTPYQIASIPYTETHGQYRYFLEIFDKAPLEENSNETAELLFILCYQKECDVLNDPQWQIAAFANKKVAKIWNIEGVKIYKLEHRQEP